MDSIKASSCIIGAVLINLTYGTFYSYGNMAPYLASYMSNNGNPDVTSEDGVWLTSTFLLGQGLSVIGGAYIEQIFDSRIALITGCIIHCISTFLTIFAIDINFTAVIIIYGFGSGIGSGCGYIASMIAAQKWFPSKKGLFTGLIVAGFGFGGLIFTNLQTLYLNPENEPSTSTGFFEERVYKRLPNCFLFMGLIFVAAQIIGCLLAFPGPTESDNNVDQIRSPNANDPSKGNVIMDEGLPEMKTALSAFKYKVFYVIAAMLILTAPGVTFVNSLGKRYGQLYIKDDKFLATAVALASIANAGGRLTWGYLVDKFNFSICFACSASLFALLISIFPFGFILSDKPLYFIWIFGLFFGFSGGFVLIPVFVEQIFGSKFSGFIYGILFIVFALSSTVTSLLIKLTVASKLADKSKADDKFYARLAPCLTIAACYLLSLVLYYSLIPVRRYENAIMRRKEAKLMKLQRGLFNRQDLFPEVNGTLAEKTAANGGFAKKTTDQPTDAIRKENSLGSIVRFAGPTQDENHRINYFVLPKAKRAP